MKTSARRNGRALTSCLRVALAEGGGKSGTLSRSFLRELSRVDPGVELHWVQSIERWVLYRLVRRGVIPSEDQMLKEVEIRGRHGEYRGPGAWLIDWMRANDKTRNGSVCPEYVDKKYLRKIDNELDPFEVQKEKYHEERFPDLVRNVERHVLGARKSGAMIKGTSKILKRKAKP